MPRTFRMALLATAATLPGLPLAAQDLALPPVSVTASPVQSGQAGSFVPLTTLDQPALAQSGARSIAEALENEPGLAATSFAPGASRPIIRGLDNFRVRLQENGFAAGDVSAYGEDHAPPLDPLAAERIEVIRGPASLRWGSQAIGGVVNLLNNRIPTELPDRAAQGRVTGGWSSGSRGWDGAASGETRAGNWVVHGDVSSRRDHDYGLPGGGSQANSFVRTDSQALGLSYIGEQGFIGGAVSHMRSLYGIPGGEEAQLGTRIDMEQIRWSSRGLYRPEAGPFQSLAYWFGLTRYQHQEIGLEHADAAGGDETAGGAVVHGGFRNQSWDGRIEAQHRPLASPLGLLDGTLGLSFEHERLRTTGEFLEFLPPATTRRAAAYLFEELALTPTLRLQAAARVEAVRITGATAAFPGGFLPADGAEELTNTARQRDFLPVSASLGLLRDLPWAMQARLTGQYVERAPSAAELFSRGAHDATGTFDIGAPGLSKESAVTLEAGLSRQAGGFRFDTSAFASRFDGFIYHALTGNSCGEDFASCAAGTEGEFLQTVYGQRDARFYGLEAKMEQDLLRLGEGQFGIRGRYDMVRARFSGGGNLPRIPPQRLGGGVFWRGEAWGMGLDYLHAFDQNRTGANETATKGYELLNARLAYTLPLDSDRVLTLALAGNNLLDRDMRNAASFKKDEVLLPGRTLRVTASLTF
ncbi:TonB-dependent receptor [Roseomonas sp. GC11]|uniref:TonB-dependent receptor n=1 Tax=Roseomonas sp. GC11 TaxID=2950546 RepID=UPI00210A1191|nr:TonB-dependent receptor [Roseomonas sp. GC11]MCQ4160492.1 TonB-dependent receptor [Roseomonas sp. GC11]